MGKSRIKVEAEKYRSRLDRVNAYNKENYKPLTIRLSFVEDRDIIDWLENIDSNKSYLCSLIRKDMYSYGKAKRKRNN